MKYYITTPELAQGISAIKAQQMGCTGATSFWWGVITHPSNGQSAICFTDKECTLADAVYDERGELVSPAETVKTLYANPPESPSLTITTNDLDDYDTLELGGWFSVGEIL